MKIITTLAFSANKRRSFFFCGAGLQLINNLCFLSPFYVYHPQAMNNTNITYIIQTLASRLIPPSLSLRFHLLTAEEDALSNPDGFMFPVTFILSAWLCNTRWVHVFCTSTFARVKRFLGFSKPFFSPTVAFARNCFAFERRPTSF